MMVINSDCRYPPCYSVTVTQSDSSLFIPPSDLTQHRNTERVSDDRYREPIAANCSNVSSVICFVNVNSSFTRQNKYDKCL